MHRKLIFIFLIIVLNGITNVTSLNLLVTIPQFILVLYFIINNKMEKAVLWHFLFLIITFTYYGDAVTRNAGIELSSYNYAKLKILGPLAYSHLISIVILIKLIYKHPFQNDENLLFDKLHKLVKYFIVSGFFIGLIGLVFGQYYIEGFVIYGSYIIIIFIHLNILIRMSKSSYLIAVLHDLIPLLLALFPIATTIVNLLNPEVNGYISSAFYSFLLFPALLYRKNISLILAGVFFLIYNSLTISTSGKSLILLLIFAFITFVLSMMKENKIRFPIRSRIIRTGMAIFFISIPSIILLLGKYFDGSTYISSKLYQLTTVLDYMSSSNNIGDIATSPYIRLTSLINIIYEGALNPITLFFGKGYGGFFSDNFNYFASLDLTQGAFPDKAITDGNFYTGHDAIVTVPMFNGIIGLILLLKTVVSFLRYAKNSYLLFSVVPFLLFTFYFDTIIGITGVLILFVGSQKVVENIS